MKRVGNWELIGLRRFIKGNRWKRMTVIFISLSTHKRKWVFERRRMTCEEIPSILLSIFLFLRDQMDGRFLRYPKDSLKSILPLSLSGNQHLHFLFSLMRCWWVNFLVIDLQRPFLAKDIAIRPHDQSSLSSFRSTNHQFFESRFHWRPEDEWELRRERWWSLIFIAALSIRREKSLSGSLSIFLVVSRKISRSSENSLEKAKMSEFSIDNKMHIEGISILNAFCGDSKWDYKWNLIS